MSRQRPDHERISASPQSRATRRVRRYRRSIPGRSGANSSPASGSGRPTAPWRGRHAWRANPAHWRGWSRGRRRKPRPSFRRALPGPVFMLGWIRRWPFLKVKFVDFAALSTLGLVTTRLTTHFRRRPKSCPWGRADHEARVLHNADPSSRQGLAAIPEGRSGSLPARRRTGVFGGLCRRARHRPGREHHLLRRLHRLAGGSHQADQAGHRHRQHAEHPSGHRRRLDRHARPHARRAADLRHQPRRAAVGCRIVRQPRRRPQRDVPGGDQPGAGDLGRQAAL